MGQIVEEDMRWIYREQKEHDFGIDAQIEIWTNSRPTGKLLAAQLKSGESYFEREDSTGFVFAGELKHLDYWLNHKLPVILILYNPATRVAYWQSVTEKTVVRTENAWKITVPRNQIFDGTQKEALEALAEGPPYLRRFVELQLARRWMLALASGNRLFLEIEQWVNKTSGKCGFELLVQDGDGNEEVAETWSYYIFYPGYPIEEAMEMVFPWANLELDHDKYFQADQADWREECGRYDREEGREYFLTDFDEWIDGQERPRLRPYEDNGETASWRLELTLNETGMAFLALDQFLQKDE